MLPRVPEGVQAMSLSGEPLISAEPSVNTLNNLAQARTEYEAEPIAENIIWYGHELLTQGSIAAPLRYSRRGSKSFPGTPVLPASRPSLSVHPRVRSCHCRSGAGGGLMDGTPMVEPDGLPNAQNIPLTTTQGNVWYHLGLAYYLKQDWPRALEAFRRGYSLGGYDDNLVLPALDLHDSASDGQRGRGACRA